MLTISQIRQAVTKIGKKYGIKNAYLFGSYAKGEATDDSDIDILIDAGAIRSYIGISNFRLDLIDELNGTDVDVITTDGILPHFFEPIKNDRIPLYAA